MIRRFFIFFLFIVASSPLPGQYLYRLKLDGTINPMAWEYISSHIKKAEQDSLSAILIYLDTPGGLMNSTRSIVKDMLNTRVPVIVYVAPAGARAGSAGLFITMAAHIAAMAPGTNIGAAHPVGLGGQMDTSQVMSQKVTNDAVAFARAIAHQRQRNEDWAEKAVRFSSSITAEDAIQENVIDLIATDEGEILRRAGEIFQKKYQQTFPFARLQPIESPMSFRQTVLNFISDPTIAYILLLLGIYGLLFEFYSPGAIFPGIIGAISLILAFFAMQALPVNAAGILLILASIVLFILEIKIASYGMLTIGGIVAFVLGSLMLFDSPVPALKIPYEIIGAAALFTLVFILIAIGFAIKAQKKKITTGQEGLIGEEGQVMENFRNGSGRILVHGEYWNAISENHENPTQGTPVEVIGKKGMTLIVKPKS